MKKTPIIISAILLIFTASSFLVIIKDKETGLEENKNIIYITDIDEIKEPDDDTTTAAETTVEEITTEKITVAETTTIEETTLEPATTEEITSENPTIIEETSTSKEETTTKKKKEEKETTTKAEEKKTLPKQGMSTDAIGKDNMNLILNTVRSSVLSAKSSLAPNTELENIAYYMLYNKVSASYVASEYDIGYTPQTIKISVSSPSAESSDITDAALKAGTNIEKKVKGLKNISSYGIGIMVYYGVDKFHIDIVVAFK